MDKERQPHEVKSSIQHKLKKLNQILRQTTVVQH